MTFKREFILSDKPPISKQIEEAQSKGLEFISKTTDRCYGYFKMPCGHTAFLHYGAIRKATNAFKCEECFDLKLTQEANLLNLVYNKNSVFNIGGKRSYTFKCGHTKVMAIGDVRNGVAICDECVNTRYKTEAALQGLELLEGQIAKDGSRMYKLPCGHIKSIMIGSVREGSWKCRVCQENRFAAEALEQDIEMLPDIKSSGHEYRVYRLKCGCIKELTMACIRKGSFECKNHSERFIDFSKPISVYLAKFILPIGEVIKVGFAMNISGRFYRYGLKGDAILLDVLTFKNGESAVQFEKYIHTLYSSVVIDKETLRPFMNNGFTECYQINLVKTLQYQFDSRRQEAELNKELNGD